MRSRSVLGWVLSGLGVLLLAAAAILFWVVVPGQAKLPSDTNETRNYEGMAKVLVNPQALAAGDRTNGILTNVPVKATQIVKATATTSSAAQVTDDRNLTSGTGQAIGATANTYAVDRKSLEATNDHPSDWNVANHQGLTVNFPIGTKKQDYTGWVAETQTTTPLKYARDEQVNGITTYVFTANVAASAIKDKQVLGLLPPALPTNLLGSLGAALPLPDQLKAALAQALPRLGNPVQLAYTYSANATYWVEPNTGRVVQVQQEDIRQAGLAGLSGVPGIPVYDVNTRTTQASVNNAVNDAKSDSNKLTLYGKTLPLTFLIVGAVALLAGVALVVLDRRRPHGGLPPVSPAPTNLTP
jgi:hypothetical protein